MSLSALLRTFRIALLASALTALSLPALASAQEQTAARKCLRGLAGIVAGVVEIPGNIYQESVETNVGLGATVGLAKGLGMYVSRELVGVYELLTAPFAAPAGFSPILDPEFPWGYFTEGSGGSAGTNDYYGRQMARLEEIDGVSVRRSGNTLTVTAGDALLFDTDSAELSPRAAPRLRSLARTLRQYPNAEIAIDGHTDSTGAELLNTGLAVRRADAVRARLVEYGVPGERITVQGFAATRPVASNETAQGRRLNRRAALELRPSVAAGTPDYAGVMSSGGRMDSGWR